jgi:hypothetical protein
MQAISYHPGGNRGSHASIRHHLELALRRLYKRGAIDVD